MELTNDQLATIKAGQPLFLPAEEIGQEIVVLSGDAYRHLCKTHDDIEDQELQVAWLKAAQKGLSSILRDDQ